MMVGDSVLERLERSDRLAELLPSLEILDGDGKNRLAGTERIGGNADRCVKVSCMIRNLELSA